jgi:hypothetical protein
VNKYNFAALIGLLLLAYGLYMIYHPLALIIPGTLLIIAGIMGARP